MFASPTVDTVMAHERAASFTKRSIKTSTKLAGLKLALSMLDLTTLEGKDSPEKVRSLCRKAIRPWERDEEVLGERLPSVAAVCVYPSMVKICDEELAGADVKIASVATGFPSGQYPLAVRLDDVRRAVADGADEIDMVINRGAFLAGRYDEVAEEIRQTKHACRRADGSFASLKVILETGELETLDNVRLASDLAIRAMHDADAEAERAVEATPHANEAERDAPQTSDRAPSPAQAGEAPPSSAPVRARTSTSSTSSPSSASSPYSPSGAPHRRSWPGHHDFIKTSTGKVTPAATMPVTLVMLEAIRDWYLQTGLIVGMKPAGGIRTAKQSLHYLVMVKETMGPLNVPGYEHVAGCPWLTPDCFRFGASTLTNDILRQLARLKMGTYMAAYDFAEA